MAGCVSAFRGFLIARSYPGGSEMPQSLSPIVKVQRPHKASAHRLLIFCDWLMSKPFPVTQWYQSGLIDRTALQRNYVLLAAGAVRFSSHAW